MESKRFNLSAKQDDASSAADRVIQEISELIRTGEILPGDRFPAERTLAEKYNVSRGTVREALHYFETLGMMKRVAGSGNYLIDDSEALYRVIGNRQLVERYNWFEMIETRQVLELGIVRLAAERATREDKLNLRRICERACKASADKTENGRMTYIKLDYQLHREFAQITRNGILLEMFEAIKDTFLEARQLWEMGNGSQERANESHTRIVNAIISGDGALAGKEMQQHLNDMFVMVNAAQQDSGL